MKKIFRFFHTIFPKACAAVAANLGGAPSKHFIKDINALNWSKTTCIYDSEVVYMVQHMIDACIIRRFEDNSI